MNQISVSKTEEYDLPAVSAAVESHFERLGLSGLFKSGVKVLIKPNLLMKSAPEQCTTTHPSLVEAVINKLFSLGVKPEQITLADSPGGPYSAVLLSGIYKASKMADVAARTGITLNTDTGFVKVCSRISKMCASFNIINPVTQADIIINIAKLKTHCMTGLSGAVKNMFGSVPGLQKPELHYRFPEKEKFGQMLVELCDTVRPQINLVDAVEAMEGNGPSGGDIKKVGYTFACTDPFLLDRFLCDVTGMDYKTVEYVNCAVKLGLAPEEVPDGCLAGDRLVLSGAFKKPDSRSVTFDNNMPRFLSAVARKFATPIPKIRKSECIGCAKCAESCPAKTINIIEKKAVIDYKACIKCYCCHEMCPAKAIDIKRFSLLKF